MEYIRVSISKERLQKLNDFYIQHFGYDVHTQLFNMLELEYQKIKNEPTEPQGKCPYPTIRKGHKKNFKWTLVVTYPDNTKSFYSHNDYDILIQIINEWSKYFFNKDKKEIVLEKIVPEYFSNIGVRGDKYNVVYKHDGKSYQFGIYDTIQNAVKVRDFMIKHDWNTDYVCNKLFEKGVLTNFNDYKHYMLHLAENE